MQRATRAHSRRGRSCDGWRRTHDGARRGDLWRWRGGRARGAATGDPAAGAGGGAAAAPPGALAAAVNKALEAGGVVGGCVSGGGVLGGQRGCSNGGLLLVVVDDGVPKVGVCGGTPLAAKRTTARSAMCRWARRGRRVAAGGAGRARAARPGRAGRAISAGVRVGRWRRRCGRRVRRNEAGARELRLSLRLRLGLGEEAAPKLGNGGAWACAYVGPAAADGQRRRLPAAAGAGRPCAGAAAGGRADAREAGKRMGVRQAGRQ